MRHLVAGKAITVVNSLHNVDELPIEAALSLLADMPLNAGGARIAVFSDFDELDNQSRNYLFSLSESLDKSEVHQVWVAGTSIQPLYDALPKRLQGRSFMSIEGLFEVFPNYLRHGDIILFKGADRTRLNEVLQRWLAETTREPSLDIVRNSSNWIIDAVILKGENALSAPSLHLPSENLSVALIHAAAQSSHALVEPLSHRCFKVHNETSSAIFRSTAPENSMPADHLCKNKQATKNLLAYAGYPVPAGEVFDEEALALHYFSNLPGSPRIVVKPVDATNGSGVSTGICDRQSLVAAWKLARRYSKKIILERHMNGLDLRIFVLDGTTRAVLVRVPVGVTGDAKSTVGELLARKKELFSNNPLTRNVQIDSWSIQDPPGIDLDFVPSLGQRISFHSNAADSKIADLVEISSMVPPRLLSLAENATKVIPGLHLSCLDLIVKDISKAPEDDNAYIVSIRSIPDISDVSFANYGDIPDLPQMLVRLALSKTPNQTRTTDTPRIIPAEALPHQSSLMLSSNSALLRQAAHRKGISCSSPASGITFLGQAENRILFYSGMSNRTSSVARDATNDKNWTCALLREAGIKTPTGRSFELNQMEEAWQFSASLQTSVVVKPLVGSGGRGVTTDISDRDHFIAAWHYACTKARSGILVEEYVKGRDFRVVVIDSWIASVTERIPAYVIGDSINTIEKLLYIKNIERSRNPYYAVKPMMLTEMNLRNLELQGFNKQSVLESGRRLQLHTVANIGAGGESRDLSEATHPDWAEIMVKARIAVYNPIHVGIDLIAEDVSQSPHNQRWAIIEINTNPDLAMIHFPGEGASRDLAGALIDTLLPSTARQRPQLESCKVTISGHVQNVGFRRWIKKQAIMHGISGWVRNNSKQQTVEAELSGTPSALQSFVKICEKGPKAARVESVHISAIPAKALNDFVVRKTLT